MSRVFLCHASKDKSFVRRLKTDLSRQGVDAWLDEEEITVGDSLREKIENALQKCSFAIVVLSKVSLQSAWVQREMNALFSLEIERNNKVILPVLKEKADLPLFLQDKKYADFSKSYSDGFDDLIKALLNKNDSVTYQIDTISCNVIMDIRRLDGSKVQVDKFQKIHANENGIDKYIEAASSDGYLKNIQVGPGLVERIWNESGITYVESKFSKPLRKREVVDYYFKSLFVDSFTGEEEYWDQRQYHPTEELNILIRFLKGRPPKECTAYEKRGPDKYDENDQLKVYLENGRTIAKFEKKKPRLLSSYVIRWKW